MQRAPIVAIFAAVIVHAQPASVCAMCHAEIARTFARTGMGRSFYAARVEAPNARPFYHAPSDTWYSMLARSGKVYQRRWQIGFDGKETNVEEKSVDFVLGSGNHAKTYLHLTARGTLQQLPLGWYAEKGGYYAMNPGYDRPDYPGSTRAVSYECMFCHNGYPRVPAANQEEGAEAKYLAPIPQGIDCQRCHGPGQQHIETAGKAAIVNPKRLTPERQLEVCMQCHLETSSLMLPHSIQRQGRGPFSYVPGQPLGDFRLAFDREPGKNQGFEVAQGAYRLRMSACFVKSAGKLLCTTCHNPHDVQHGERAIVKYDSVCRTCHASLPQTHTAAATCTACHMPKRRTTDAVHIVMTDHYIQRRPPGGDLTADRAEEHETAATSYRGKVALYYPPQLPATPENALDEAVAQVRDRSNLVEGSRQLAALIDKYKPQRAGYYADLADASRASGDHAKSIATLDEAVKRSPNSLVLLLKLGNGLMETGQWPAAESAFRRATVRSPSDPVAIGLLGWTLWQQQRGPEARAALERATQLDPDQPDLHNYLGQLLVGAGDRSAATKEFRAALRIQPGIAEWQSNLANLLASQGQLAEARYHFDESLKLNPDYAPAHLGYARLLANTGEVAAAVPHLMKAAQSSDVKAAAAARQMLQVLRQ